MTATIISTIIAVLLYFNIKPSNSHIENEEVNNDVIISEQSSSKERNQDVTNHPITIKEESEFNNTLKEGSSLEKSKLEDGHKNNKTWEEMTEWDVIRLPFIKHEKRNYFKIIWEEYGWRTIVLLFCLICSPFGIILFFIGYLFEEIKDERFTIPNIIGVIFYIAFIIYIILYILAFFGGY